MTVSEVSWRSVVVWSVGSCLAAFVLFGLVALPVKVWLSQSDQYDTANAEVAELNSEIERLELDLELLTDDAEIERRARQDFGLARPGEEVYRVIE